MTTSATAPLPASVLEALGRYDTPTICNAMEIVAPDRRLIGFTTKPLVCPFPDLPPIVGYARTVAIRSVLKSSLAPDEHALPRYIFPQQNGLQPETSTGGTVDVYWRRRIGDAFSLYMSQAFFFTQVDNPLVAQTGSGDTLLLFNATSPLRTYGSDSYVRLTGEDLELYLGYTWTHALRTYDDAHPFLPVTPPHRVSFVIMYEPSAKWRVGVEGSWLSRQYRDDGTRTHSYMIGALMLAHEWRRWSFVLNCENILNVLQSHYEPLYTGTRLSPDFQPLWAPVDGRVANFSVRFHW